MKINNKILILLAYLIITSCSSYAQDGLILPMPGQKPSTQNTNSSEQNKSNTQKQQNTNKQQNNWQNNLANTGPNKGQINSGNSKDSILPMPNLNNDKTSSSETKRGNKSGNQSGNKNNVINSDGQTFISLPASNNNKQQSQNQNKQQNQNQNKQQNQKQDQKKKNSNKDQSKPIPQKSNKRTSSTKVPLSIDDDDSGFFSKDLEIPDWDDELEDDSSLSSSPSPSTPSTSPSPDSISINDLDSDLDSDSDSDFESPASSGGNDLDDKLDTANKKETTVAQNSSGENIKVFPKDTGAAIFMVMKSWNCEDYDVVSLINQALDVYGKEAGEEFKIQGMENFTKGLTVSVEEEDITYDELLDIIAAKSGNDWGCDLANKVIYIYPKGIKTESFLSWDDE